MNTDWNELEDGRVPIETPNWAQTPLMVPMISSSRGAAVVHSCHPWCPHTDVLADCLGYLLLTKATGPFCV